jgi:hypothetical protein
MPLTATTEVAPGKITFGRPDKVVKYEPVGAVQQFHTAWRVRMARRGQGIDHERSFLALKLVDYSDAGAQQCGS